MRKTKIIADIHEKNSFVLVELREKLKREKEVELDVCPLKIGDYQIEDIVIERKTIPDFKASMINRRIINQLENLKLAEKKFLILEGSSDDFYTELYGEPHSKLNPNSIRGFILHISLYYNIPIIFSRDEEDTASYLILLAKQQLKDKTEGKISLHFRIPKTLSEQKRYILEAFPNIGPVKAKKLLETFSTLENIFNAKEEELRNILKGKTSEFLKILKT